MINFETQNTTNICSVRILHFNLESHMYFRITRKHIIRHLLQITNLQIFPIIKYAIHSKIKMCQCS